MIASLLRFCPPWFKRRQSQHMLHDQEINGTIRTGFEIADAGVLTEKLQEYKVKEDQYAADDDSVPAQEVVQLWRMEDRDGHSAFVKVYIITAAGREARLGSRAESEWDLFNRCVSPACLRPRRPIRPKSPTKTLTASSSGYQNVAFTILDHVPGRMLRDEDMVDTDLRVKINEAIIDAIRLTLDTSDILPTCYDLGRVLFDPESPGKMYFWDFEDYAEKPPGRWKITATSEAPKWTSIALSAPRSVH
ncbi:hypothetical protein KVT40_009259 [Elsinoe batatas]|uniref:Uncharacterized protein n=1 Tax=Elsinoe batatas TaxID=2601811 RepID=A0A8K0KTL8_9PEZI|nr:hypothetical protein KVT40_009259 [Elsinoe batatas]